MTTTQITRRGNDGNEYTFAGADEEEIGGLGYAMLRDQLRKSGGFEGPPPFCTTDRCLFDSHAVIVAIKWWAKFERVWKYAKIR